MTDLREKFARIIAFEGRCRHDVSPDADVFWAHCHAETHATAYRQADAILAALPVPVVRVKELEWEGRPLLRAFTNVGCTYTIRKESADMFDAHIGGKFLSHHSTIEAAKAACQSDFARRTLPHVEAVSEAQVWADERERLAKLFESGFVAEGNSIQADIPAVIRAQGGGQ